MSALSFTLPEADKDRLAAIAARHGVSLEQAAALAVKAHLDADAAARAEVEAGLGELEAGQGMTLAQYEREMDAFMATLGAPRG